MNKRGDKEKDFISRVPRELLPPSMLNNFVKARKGIMKRQVVTEARMKKLTEWTTDRMIIKAEDEARAERDKIEAERQELLDAAEMQEAAGGSSFDTRKSD